jgi:hypoxanthine phosphoribosyltransferase
MLRFESELPFQGKKALVNPMFETVCLRGKVPILLRDEPGLAVLASKDDVKAQINSVGLQLRFDYQDRDMTTIQILEGGAWIHAQVARKLPEASTHQVLSIKAKRYGNERVGRELKIYDDWIREHEDEHAKIRGRHCLITDDVLDEGVTMAAVIDVVKSFGPASIRTLFLAKKDVPRKVTVPQDYVLFECDNHWLVGAGLDDNGIGRDRPQLLCKWPRSS